MNAILLLSFIFVTYAIGDIISVKTKSIVSTMFTCSVIFIVGFWLGIPQTLFTDSQLAGIGSLLITLLLVHMGTLMSLKQLKEQWKVVLVACVAVIGISLVLLTVGPLIIGRAESLVAAPVISGGLIAALMMQDAVVNAGLGNADALVVFATVLMVMEGFIGYPVASFCLKKEGILIKKSILNGTYVDAKEEIAADIDTPKKKLFPALPEKYASENVYLAKIVLVALLATFLSSVITKFTGSNIIDKNIMSLLLGILFSELGFLERDVLTKANSGGLAMAALLAVIFSSLSKATPEIIISLLPAIIGANILGVIGYSIVCVIVGRFLKISPWMCIAIGSTANFGFPGTFIVSKEVANSLGDTPEMSEQILNKILPKMLVSGFVTVSIASVFMAALVSMMV